MIGSHDQASAASKEVRVMNWKKIGGVLLLLTGASLVAAEAQAIIGRPLTPLSYAGVARRTVRRSMYY